MKRKRKGEEGKISRRVLLLWICLYAMLTGALFFLLLISADRILYEGSSFGMARTEDLVIRDGETVSFAFAVPEENPAGVTLNEFYNNGLDFDGEYLDISVFNEDAKESAGGTRILLAEQYSEALYRSSLYIPFDRDIAEGSRLTLTIRSFGLHQEGIVLGLSDEYELAGSLSVNGEAEEGTYLCAALYQAEHVTDYRMAFAFLAGAFLAGVLICVISVRFFPNLLQPSSDTVPARRVNRPGKRGRTVRMVTALLLCSAVFWEYIYTFTIKKNFARLQALQMPFILIAVSVTAALIILSVLLQKEMLRPEKVFFVSAVCFGLVMSLLIPPYCVPDERAHIDTAYHTANEMMGITTQAGPSRIWKRTCDIDGKKSNTVDTTPEMYLEETGAFMKRAEDVSLKMAYAVNTQANASLMHYYPVAAGFVIGRLTGRNLITMILFGRWANLIICCLLMYFGIRKLPYAKEIFMITGLLPVSLQQLASCSYDGVILAASCLWIGYILSAAETGRYNLVDLTVLCASGGFLAISKGGVYLPLLGLAAFLIFWRRPVPKERKLIFAGITLSAAAAFLARFGSTLATIASKGNDAAVRYNSKGEVLQIYSVAYLKSRLTWVVRLFENTIYKWGDNILAEILGSRLGKVNLKIPWFVLCGFLLVLVTAVANREDRCRDIQRSKKYYVCFLCLLGIGLISLSMLLTWTSVGSDMIDGLQGRYYFPYLGLGLCFFPAACRRRAGYEAKTLLLWTDILLGVTFGNLIMFVLK